MSDTVTRLAEIRAAIGRAERDFGRKPGSAALVAVSKTKPAEQIVEALEAGQRIVVDGTGKLRPGLRIADARAEPAAAGARTE